MNYTPLFEAFVKRLERDGIPVSVRDYSRFAEVFHAETDWTFDRVKDTLGALVATDQEQQRLFDQRFDAFFQVGLKHRGQEPAIDLARALVDFQKARRRSPRPAPYQRMIVSTQGKTVIALSWVWGGLGGLASILALVWIVFHFDKGTTVLRPVGNLRFTKGVLDFGTLEPGSASMKRVGLRNETNAAVFLKDAKSEPENSFKLVPGHEPGTVWQPGTELTFEVLFLASGEGAQTYRGSLRIETSFDPKPVMLPLSGEVRSGTFFPIVPAPVAEGSGDGPPTSLKVDVIPLPLPMPVLWLYWLAAAGLVLIAAAVFGFYLWRSSKPPKDLPAEYDPSGPTHFAARKIGGEPEPWLEEDVLQAAAELAGYYLTPERGRVMDARRSIWETIRRGGFPTIRFFRKTASRTLLILEDMGIPAEHRGPVAAELAKGLAMRGIPVIHGRFERRLATFSTLDGNEYRLIDLEKDKTGLTLLIFGDGSFIPRRRDPAWENLMWWPRVAWMDTREAGPDGPIPESGLPVFPATGKGILACLRYFAGERTALSGEEARERPLLADMDETLETEERWKRYLEAYLGNALLWAGDCTFLQPCSPGMADVLRRRFHAYLPPQRIQRLVGLAGTRVDRGGFAFDRKTMRALRQIWAERRDPSQQKAVLDLIQEEIEKAKPASDGQKPSLEYLAWEARWERLRLEKEPQDLERLAKLAASPVGAHLKASLVDFVLPGRPAPGKIALGSTSANRDALQRLAGISPELGITRTETYPLAVWQKGALGILILAMFFCSGMGFWEYRSTTGSLDYWRVENLGAGTATLVNEENGEILGVWGRDWTARSTLVPGRYRIDLKHGEKQLSDTFQVADPRNTAVVRIARKMTLTLTRIDPGRFIMGSPESEEGRLDNEIVHEVSLTRGFYLGTTEVTRAWYREIMGDLPREEQGGDDELPVSLVSWQDAVEFCRRLTIREKERLPAGYAYRLPTEAQWEYAARAGSTTGFCFGDDEQTLGEYAWYYQNSGDTPHPVGTKNPNAWGLYDMHGNVWEWCRDWYEENAGVAETDPSGPAAGRGRVVRGGSWISGAQGCRSAVRGWDGPDDRDRVQGFRVAAVQVTESGPEPEGRGRMELVWLEPGTFLMGSPENEDGRNNDERQLHVTLSQTFAMGKKEVTQAQYQTIMGDNPSHFKNPDKPVHNVSWHDAFQFCQKLTDLHHQAGILPLDYEYRLPTEAQWEYAARAGSTTRFCYGDDDQKLGEYAWYFQNSNFEPRQVGKKKPNVWDLYDMHGNLWEWCWDWYGEFASIAETDPGGPDEGRFRVFRGGGWGDVARACRVADRSRLEPDLLLKSLGFRVAAVQVTESGSDPEKRGRMELVWLEPGTFLMGSPESEKGRQVDELQHEVTLTYRFGMGKYEVTQEQFERIMGHDPSYFKRGGPHTPVERVSWEDAMAFCQKLTLQDQTNGTLPDGFVYRLPTEAEWEYACRAGTSTPFSFGSNTKDLERYGNICDKNCTSGWDDSILDDGFKNTAPVGSYEPNAWGLYDMHGNVWEWCFDHYSSYPLEPVKDPVVTKAATRAQRVFRGGSWNVVVRTCRSGERSRAAPTNRYQDLGFRVAAVPEDKAESERPRPSEAFLFQ